MTAGAVARFFLAQALPRFGRLLGVVALLWLAGCAAVRLDVPRTPSYAIDNPQETALAISFARQLAATPGQSGVHLLVSGQEAFAARAALAESAQRTLDLQYYLVMRDSTATLLLHRALLAAERGVRVRLLIDDMNTGLGDGDLAMLSAHPNVQVRLFNPFAIRGLSSLSRALELLGHGDRLNRRMHNKLWIADNAAVVMGGRNLGDAYFDADSEGGFADLDVLVAGEVVPGISHSFDHYWNSEWTVPIEAFAVRPVSDSERDQAMADMAARAEQFRSGDYVRSVRATELGQQLRAGQLPMTAANATALYDAPGDPRAEVPGKHGEIFPALREIVEKAQREVILVSPYLVPGDRTLDVICGLAKRGVRVRILTNSLASTDVPVVHAGYARYRPGLLACGAEVHELRPAADRTARARRGLSSGASLHTKAVIVDGQTAFIGSMNLDPRSRSLNTEVALRIESAPLGRQLVDLFDEATALDQAFRVELDEPGNPAAPLHWTAMEDDKPVRYTREPLASTWRRILTPIFGWLAPEDLL